MICVFPEALRIVCRIQSQSSFISVITEVSAVPTVDDTRPLPWQKAHSCGVRSECPRPLQGVCACLRSVLSRAGPICRPPGSIREENGVRWHVCPCCAKEFRKPSDLVRHIRIHTHEKPFKCPQCFRAFAVKSTLTAHIKTHTGIKAFKCQYCMKSFSTSGSLKVHIRLHTGARGRWGIGDLCT